ncbi:hypothetical protein QUV83_03250 [Cellulomonas cellasea]|nr:hypothetical protein [Cellulomonas cellasea]MDM8083781.1 hypothetical protein [Cellulomonas cellasea]
MAQPSAPGIDVLASAALHVLDESLTRCDLPTRACWVLFYSEAPA